MRARVCPYCRELNGAEEPRCYRCGRRLPSPLRLAFSRVVGNAFGIEAPVTAILLVFVLLVYALCALTNGTGGAEGDSFRLSDLLTGFRTSTLVRFGALGGNLGTLEPWRILSAVFVHAGVLHIVMNMLAHVSFGQSLERMLGSARFAVLFVVSGFLGFVASELWYGFSGPTTMGASGAVFGELGAVGGILLARRDPQWRRALLSGLVYSAIAALAFPVNTAAHLGGMVAGAALGFVLHKEQQRLKLNGLMGILAVLALALSVASVVLSTQSILWQFVKSRELLMR